MAAIILNQARRIIDDTSADSAKRVGAGIVRGALIGLVISYPVCLEWVANTLSRPILGLPLQSPPRVYTSILTGALAGGLANTALQDRDQVDTIITAVSLATVASAFLAPENLVFKVLADSTEYLALSAVGILAVMEIRKRFAA